MVWICAVCSFFFFQAEDGIRDYKVTGVQTCALPILRPARDPERQTYVISTFQERMQQFGFEGRTLLYTLDGEPRLVGGTWSEAEAVLRRADVVLNFHYAIDPRLLTYARRTALVDIDPGLLQFWMSTGQLNVPAHDCYLTTGETVGTPARSEEHTSEL